MALKELFVPHLGHTVKFGRKRAPHGTRKLQLSKYLTGALPTPPASCDYTAKSLPSLTNVYLNDQLGDCVIAGGYHVEGTATGNATGTPFVATTAQIVADYSAIGGYNPNAPLVDGQNPTDQGCDEPTALNYWQNHGFCNGTKLAGWVAVDPTNKLEVMQAMYLFENLYFGVELPDAWVNPFPSGNGFTWDVGAPDPQNGHCFIGVGYTAAGVTIDTWGLFGTLTWAAVAALCSAADGGDLFVMLTPDQLAKGQAKAPNGFAWADLVADFDAMGGKVTPVAPPAPTPPGPTPPAPTPPAPAGVTLVQAQTWAAQGLLAAWPMKAGHGPVVLNEAQTWAAAGLKAHWPK